VDLLWQWPLHAGTKVSNHIRSRTGWCGCLNVIATYSNGNSWHMHHACAPASWSACGCLLTNRCEWQESVDVFMLHPLLLCASRHRAHVIAVNTCYSCKRLLLRRPLVPHAWLTTACAVAGSTQ
jgi:hypothetical protein